MGFVRSVSTWTEATGTGDEDNGADGVAWVKGGQWALGPGGGRPNLGRRHRCGVVPAGKYGKYGRKTDDQHV